MRLGWPSKTSGRLGVLMLDRVAERRRAAQLARHYRDQEGLSIAEIARRLGRAEATVKARYRGVCRGCGAPTAPRNGKGDAYAYCKRCHPGAIAPQWTRERVREAMRERLLRAHRRRPFTQVLIITVAELRGPVAASLDRELGDVQLRMLSADLGHASPVEITRVAAPVIEGLEQARERAMLLRLERSLEISGAAAVGLDDVLAALEQNRVEVLMIARGTGCMAGRCPRCGRTSISGGRCKVDGAPLATVDGIERAIELAAGQGAEVMVVCHERPDLIARGSAAALLGAPRGLRTRRSERAGSEMGVPVHPIGVMRDLAFARPSRGVGLGGRAA